jgi:RNA polymerase sigma-70 factor (ECF subfamily)
MHPTSLTLLQRLRDIRDQDAWRRFVHVYGGLILYWVRRAHVPAGAQEDVVQELLLKLVHQLPTFDYQPGGTFRGWLRRVTERHCQDRNRRGVPTEQLDTELLTVLPTASDLVTELSAREEAAYVTARAWDFVQREFNAKDCRIFTDHVLQERPAEEVATDLGVAVATVYRVKSRILRRLREYFVD